MSDVPILPPFETLLRNHLKGEPLETLELKRLATFLSKLIDATPAIPEYAGTLAWTCSQLLTVQGFLSARKTHS